MGQIQLVVLPSWVISSDKNVTPLNMRPGLAHKYRQATASAKAPCEHCSPVEANWPELPVDDLQRPVWLYHVGFIHLSTPLVYEVVGERRSGRGFRQLGAWLAAISDTAGDRLEAGR